MMSVRAACVALLVGLVICAVSARPSRGKGGRLGRLEDKPKPLVAYACSIASEEGVMQRECDGGASCTLGPLVLEGRHNDTLTAFFCTITPSTEEPLPGVLKASCLVETDEGIQHERECPMTSDCDLGPIEFNTENGNITSAYFCTKPEEKPDHSKESESEESESDESESEESEEEDGSSEERRRIPGAVRGRRQRRHAGGREGRGGRGGRGGHGGLRRPKSLMSYACNVINEQGKAVRVHSCLGDAECTLGPLSLEGKGNDTLTAYFCDVEITLDRLLMGVVGASCLVETDNEILHEGDCPETSMCDLGPLDLTLTEGPAYAYFCTKPQEGRMHHRRGKNSSEEDISSSEEDASSSEEDLITEAPGSPDGEAPMLPEGEAPMLPEGRNMQGAE